VWPKRRLRIHANGHLSCALRAPVRSKSFLDRALLDEDLSRFTALPALLALNAFELALLAVKLVCRRCLRARVCSLTACARRAARAGVLTDSARAARPSQPDA
jgi:hypothetical protein